MLLLQEMELAAVLLNFQSFKDRFWVFGFQSRRCYTFECLGRCNDERDYAFAKRRQHEKH